MIQPRLFHSEADYAAMRGLLIAAGADPLLRAYCSVGDLEWWRATMHDGEAILRRAPLWWEEERLIAFIWPSGANADLLVHPQHRELEPELLEWVEANLAAADGDAPHCVTTWAVTKDAVRVALLEDRSYTRTDNHLIFHTADLRRSIPAPELPPGFAVRAFAGEPEIEARVAVHRSAFHPSRMTVEKHRRVMASPTYRQELDLMVIAPDGTPAAYCIVWHDAVNRFGVFEPMGTHQEHRRLGLAKAVLRHGQRLLQELGAETAHVCAAGGNDASSALYPAAGFAVVDRIEQWQRQIEQ